VLRCDGTARIGINIGNWPTWEDTGWYQKNQNYRSVHKKNESWMEFIKQPTAKPEYGGRVLITKEVYEEIQRDAIKNHCHACGASVRIIATDCLACGATDVED